MVSLVKGFSGFMTAQATAAANDRSKHCLALALCLYRNLLAHFTMCNDKWQFHSFRGCNLRQLRHRKSSQRVNFREITEKKFLR